jgi:glucosamine-6-phosphate deaminase
MIRILPSSTDLARAAAAHAAESLRKLLVGKPIARILAATGNSQLEFLDALAHENGIDWTRVELFHLDEYVGIGIDHPASFARYIRERIVDRFGIRTYHLLNGLGDPHKVARDMGAQLASAPVDLAFCGIGENGHLAFNDPPADFEAAEPYLVVQLDHACREQQVGEGWFAFIDEVPKQAISVSIPRLLKSQEIICVVPDARKAAAVKACLEGSVSPLAPASILRIHPNAHIYLDQDSAALLMPGRASEEHDSE